MSDGLPQKREIEAALRGAGLSARQAKRLLARGWAALDVAGHDDEAEELVALANALAHRLRETSR